MMPTMLARASRAMPGALVRRSCAVSQVRCMSAAVPKVPMLINNEFVHSSTDKFIELRNPANNEVIGLVPESTQEEMEAATAAAKAAYPAWRDTSVQNRMRIMLKYQALIREHHDELAELVTLEQGKTKLDAWGDVFRGLEVRVDLAGPCSVSFVVVIDGGNDPCLYRSSSTAPRYPA